MRLYKSVALTLAAALLANPIAAQDICRSDTVIVARENGPVRFSVEIADDAAERARGLMHRESLSPSAGMLFVYEEPQSVSFWMANTLIPLDMIFADRRGMITRIHENAVPLDRTGIFGGEEVFAVLEINGGLSDSIGFKVGDVLQHPAFGSDALMPCAVD